MTDWYNKETIEKKWSAKDTSKINFKEVHKRLELQRELQARKDSQPSKVDCDDQVKPKKKNDVKTRSKRAYSYVGIITSIGLICVPVLMAIDQKLGMLTTLVIFVFFSFGLLFEVILDKKYDTKLKGQPYKPKYR